MLNVCEAKEKTAPYKEVHSNEKTGKCFEQLHVNSEKPMHGSSNTQEFQNRINITEELQSDLTNDSFGYILFSFVFLFVHSFVQIS